HYNGRDFTHIGLGFRQKNDHSFYGVNTFYDYDLTRNHQRASIGAEYGLSNITFASNFYFPISNWKSSPERFGSMNKTPLEARPAKGVDAILSGFLPQFPWLSLNTSYTQFFGSHVEVSNGEEPVKNPYQVGISLGYQPIPLLSFSAGYTHEKGGVEGANFNTNVIYHFGVPFNQQINPTKVGVIKTLNAQLFNLVKRDNNIRLEYREKKPDFKINFNSPTFQVKEGSTTALSSWVTIVGEEADIVEIHFKGSANKNIQSSGIISTSHYLAPLFNSHLSNDYQLSLTVKLKNNQVIMTPSIATITVLPDTISHLTMTITSKSGDK
ncbi:hypothetical protein C9J21_22270, partial [Photobacterium phosphoreum]|uniref:inverse autotransporter beta domain-containing protein n=1 Tax=Photobacterium phosphoreum TaxID=659 RepID=UPI000D4ECB45